MTEQWRPIPGHTGYEASDLGKVRSLPREVRCGRKKNAVRTIQGQVLRPGRSSSGHFTVALGRGQSVSVHVAVATAFLGPVPKDHEVLHRDGNPANNTLSNLRFGTRSENNRDISRHGRRRLTLAQVAECKRRHWEGGETQTSLAEEFGVCISQMNNIVHGRHYVLSVR